MSQFAYFNFTCGNFTRGRGHVRFRHDQTQGVEEVIMQNLEENGEQNCNVVIKRMNNVESDWLDKTQKVNYQIDARWYSNIPAVAGLVAPLVGPAILKSLNSE